MAKKMNSYLVSYDLMQLGQNYEAIQEYLKQFPGWIKPLESVFLIYTARGCDDILDNIKNIIDGNDKVIIVKLDTIDWAVTTNLPKTNDWIVNH